MSVQMVLPASVGMLQRGLLVAMRMAFDRHRDGERRDVAGIRDDVDPERRRVAAVALRPDAEPVGAVEQLFLERIERRIWIRRADFTEQRLLRQERRLLEGPTNADAQDERRARGRSR